MEGRGVDEGMTVIDVDAIANTAFTGVNRAWMFLGLGVNAASRAERSDFEIADASHLRLLPEELPPPTLEDAKTEFAIWVASNGLREVIDTFDVFLGKVQAAALSVQAWKAGVASDADSAPYNKCAAAFSRLGTEKRLDSLRKDFAITAEYGPDIVSIRRARNCLTHRLGVVGSEDVGTEDHLTLGWHAFELYGWHPDGSEFVASPDSLPVAFPKGSPVNLRHGLREHRYGLGERIILSPAELKEICFTFRFTVDQVRQSLVEFMEGAGVQQVDTGGAPASDGAST
jgi:hypothetical protein